MGTDTDLQTRVEDLEMKLTFQDDLLEQLSQSIIQQQNDIKLLTQLVEKTNAKIQDIQQPSQLDPQLEPPPPHY